jgi:ribosome-associated toxin RatA of RatAB toxin-antitoxin module
MKQPIQNKALNVMLVMSMVWMGAGSYIPTAYAETSSTPVQENELVSTLSKLEIEGVKLDQSFSPSLNEYSATVGNELQTIKVLVESSKTASSININGQEVKSGTADIYSLQTGENMFIITLTDGSNSINTYTVKITREENANNLLQNIELSKGQLSPKFSSAVTDYNVDVPNSVAMTTIKPTPVETTSSIKVNGTLTGKDGADVDLPIGKSDIMILVTAENGEEKTYTLHVTRDKAAGDKAANPIQNNNKPAPSQQTAQPNNRPNSSQSTLPQQQNSQTIEKASKALLSSLSISKGTWDSTFTSEEFTYHVTVSNNTDEVTLNPIASYSSSEISIEGSTSKTIRLDNDKKTIISVVVTNGDDDRKTYVLVFDKES